METKKKLIWYCPNPTHYQKYLFNKIQDSNLFDFEVVYFNESLRTYPWKDKFKIETKSSTLNKTFINIDFGKVFQSKDKSKVYIIAGWSEPTMFFMLTYFALRRFNYIINTDTPRNRKIRGLKQRIRKIWLDFILSRANSILVTGQIGVEVVKEWGIKNVLVYNFPFTTDCEFFYPKPIKRDHFIIFSSGRLDIAHKGYDVAFNALKMLKEHVTHLKIEYRIAGVGPDCDELLDLCSNLGLKDDVKFLGWKEIDELPSLYNECDIFLHPSNFDPFPNAVLEAMACGCIIVASDKAGSAVERITNNENGFLHKAGDSENLFLLLKDIINLPEQTLLKVREESRKTAEKWGFEYNLGVLSNVIN